VIRRSGAARIFLYNWPIYVGTWLGSALVVLVAATVSQLALYAAMAAGGLAVLWSVASLAVSYHVYDRSPLALGTWLPSLLRDRCDAWATIHAGLDQEIELDSILPGVCAARLDVFDPRLMTAPSIRRARVRTPASRPATACSPTALALADGTCDVVVVAFTAHEIRDRGARERFFDEVGRGLRAGGRMLLVEHVRDVPNFLAFGPGFLHFLPRAEWRRLGSRAGWALRDERRITPWVMALTLEKST
jgi:SAM-dependent methyltransferase